MLTLSLTTLLVALCTFIHYETLRFCNDRLQNLNGIAGRATLLLAMATAFLSHLTQIALFAGAYWIAHDTPLGSLRGQLQDPVLSFVYFSAETYTSLGFGDVYPMGQMRLLAGIEALTGLLMISWTASYTYLEMGRHWGGCAPNPRRTGAFRVQPQTDHSPMSDRRARGRRPRGRSPLGGAVAALIRESPQRHPRARGELPIERSSK